MDSAIDTITCRMCHVPMNTRNRICPTCGTISNHKSVLRRTPPVKLFMVLAWLFVAYAYLDFMKFV